MSRGVVGKDGGMERRGEGVGPESSSHLSSSWLFCFLLACEVRTGVASWPVGVNPGEARDCRC